MSHNTEHQLQAIDGWQDELVERLVALSQINSGSLNADGVNRVGEALSPLYTDLGASAERIAVDDFRSTTDEGERSHHPLGDAFRFRQRPDAPLQVFLCGHLDTVFAADHPFQQVKRPDDDTLHGPGVADLKGGLMVMVAALRALEASPWRDAIGWEVLLNPDEEIGSASSAHLLREAAERNHLGLIFEPSFPDGNLAGERKGSGNFDVIVRGRAAHAGREHHLGRNAIRACADFVAALDDLNGQRDGVTINPGYVHGGGALNVVPPLCLTRFNVRTQQPDDEAWFEQQLQTLLADLNDRDGIRAELEGGFTRPPKVWSDDNRRLAEAIADCASDLGLELDYLPTGGCCDGNNLAAAGLPNIDNLGVVGGKIHSADEYMRISSLAERGRLSALLLLRLASGELEWPAAAR